MLKLNAAAVIVGSFAAATVPTPVKRAEVEPVRPAIVGPSPIGDGSSLPEFVSAVNFGEFVRASRESSSVTHDEGRAAAERMIERMSGPAATRSDKEFLRAVVETKPDAGAASSTARPAEVALASPTAEERLNADPSRNDAIAAVDAEPAPGGADGRRDADPAKPTARSGAAEPTAITLTRKHEASATTVDGAPSKKLQRKRSESRSVFRVKRRQIANADAAQAPGLFSLFAAPPAADASDKPDSRAIGGPTQSMAPFLSKCGPMTDACKANQSWCGCGQ